MGNLAECSLPNGLANRVVYAPIQVKNPATRFLVLGVFPKNLENFVISADYGKQLAKTQA